MCFMLLIQPKSIKATHKGRLRVKVKVRWLVDVKIYGNSPIILLHRIKKKTEVRMIVRLELETFSKILNSDLSFLKSLLKTIKFFVGKAQKIGKAIKINKKVLTQLRERLKNEEGSNTEKRFLIIVNFFYSDLRS